ncbi:hypothetical protein ACFL96_02345 [Thermoproteota archaeon]
MKNSNLSKNSINSLAVRKGLILSLFFVIAAFMTTGLAYAGTPGCLGIPEIEVSSHAPGDSLTIDVKNIEPGNNKVYLLMSSGNDGDEINYIGDGGFKSQYGPGAYLAPNPGSSNCKVIPIADARHETTVPNTPGEVYYMQVLEISGCAQGGVAFSDLFVYAIEDTSVYDEVVKVIETAGINHSNLLVTFAYPLRQGEYIDKIAVKHLETSTILKSQIHPTAFYDYDKQYNDNSGRNVLVTTRLPNLAANGTATLQLVNQKNVAPQGNFQLGIPYFDIIVTWEDPVEGQLKASIKTADQKKIKHFGKFMIEGQAWTTLKDSNGVATDQIDVGFLVRLYSGVNAAEVTIAVENTRSRLDAFGNDDTTVFRDRPFNSLKIEADFNGDGVGDQVLRAETTPKILYDMTRYIKTERIGPEASELQGPDNGYIVVYPNWKNLVYAGRYPSLNDDFPLPESDVNRWFNNIRTDVWNDSGFIMSYMPTSGGRPDIGPMTYWGIFCARAAGEPGFSKQTLKKCAAIMEAEITHSGWFPNKVRDSETGKRKVPNYYGPGDSGLRAWEVSGQEYRSKRDYGN